MKVAVVGSRGVTVDIAPYVPPGATTIVSGGAVGIDTCAAAFARARGLGLVEIRPDYARYGRGAPLRRNSEIVGAADRVLAFWDGTSRGTLDAIVKARALGKPIRVLRCAGGFVVADDDRAP